MVHLLDRALDVGAPACILAAVEREARFSSTLELLLEIVDGREPVRAHVLLVRRARGEPRVAHVLVTAIVPQHRVGVARLGLVVERHLDEHAVTLDVAASHPGSPPAGGAPGMTAGCCGRPWSAASFSAFISFVRACDAAFCWSAVIFAVVFICVDFTSALAFIIVALTSAWAFCSSGLGGGGCCPCCCIIDRKSV